MSDKQSLVSGSRLIQEGGLKNRLGNLFVQWEVILLIMFLFEIVLFTSLTPYFLDYFNLMNATFTFMEKAIIALPMMFVIISGDIDISVAGIISLCSFSMGFAASQGAGTFPIIVIGLVVGLLAGLFNGFFVTKMKMPAIAVTLASMYVFRGIAQAVLQDQAYTDYPASFAYFGQGYFGNTIIPFQLVFFLILAVVMGFVLHKTTYGRKVFAIGNSDSASLFSGIKVDRVRMINFALNGLFSGISAILLTSRIGSTRPNIALGFELEAITLVVLGGVAITGGKGNILGVILAVFFIGYLKFGMGLLNMSAKIMIITTGLLLIIAVLLPGMLDIIKKKAKIAETTEGVVIMRVAFTMKLKPGCEDEYKKRHAEIWPELRYLLKQQGVSDYSIFLEPQTLTLFGVQNVAGVSGGSQDLGSNPMVQRWWAYMADLMETNPDNSPVTIPLEEMFYME